MKTLRHVVSVVVTFCFLSLFSTHVVQAAPQESRIAALKVKAQSKGKVPVIVRLKSGEILSSSSNGLVSSAQKQERKSRQKALMRKMSSARVLIERVKNYENLPVSSMTLDADGIEMLRSNSDVEEVFEDVLLSPTLLQSVQLIGSSNTGISGATGSGQVVAVLDTGVEKTHSFLSGKVVHEACFSTTSSDSTTLCPNGQDSQIGSGAGVACGISGCAHGTHVAGIVAGRGSTFSGVARDADIMAIQVFSRFSASYCGGSECVLSWSSDMLMALDHIYSQRNNFNIASVNMSIGGGQYTSACDSNPIQDAILTLKSVGIATVIASGNDTYTNAVSYPGCASAAVTVGATDKSDNVASYSNSSSLVDLLAPGSSINSSVTGSGYAYYSGTSMATPHVAGAFAAIKSKYPTKTVDEILAVLKAESPSVTDSRNGRIIPRLQLDTTIAALKSNTNEDFDGDGMADVFWRNVDTRSNLIHLVDGSNVKESRVYSSMTDAGWKLAGVGDFDDDGDADIVWRHTTTGSNRIHIMQNGSVVSGALISTIADQDHELVGVGDLDGDGDDDLFWRNKRTAENLIYLMNGTQITLNTVFNGTASTNWVLVGMADFNGDEKADLLWRNQQTNTLWLHLMNGHYASQGVSVPKIASSAWEIVGVQDFDSDGKADLLLRNNITGTNWLRMMNGGAIKRAASVRRLADTNWKVGQVADFDGDGDADILWRNTSSGVNWMYFMNGEQITKSSRFYTPSTSTSSASGGTINFNPLDTDWRIKGKL